MIWLARLALLAYPRAFRRRFGAEMRADLRRAARERGQAATLRLMLTLVAAGLAERWAALVRLIWWPTDRAHLYEPTGRHFMFWDTLRSDLRHTLRLAARTPLVTGLTILALALGIGANSAIFTVVDSVLLRPLPYRDSAALVNVWSDATRQGRPRNPLSPANFVDFQRQATTLEGLEGYFSFITPLRLQSETATEMIVGLSVTPRLFDLLGRTPLIGRSFSTDASAGEVLLSYGFWQRRLGGDTSIVGRALQTAGGARTVVGVMPPDFTFPYGAMLGPSGFTRSTAVDLWLPIQFSGADAAANRMLTPQGQLVRNVHWFGAIGRIKGGADITRVQAELTTVARQMEAAFPDSNAGWGATVVSTLDQTVGDIRTPLLVLLAGVGVVLIIATVNVANLVLARSVARQKELATRVALGAGQRRLVQQALTEGLVLAVCGGLAGLLLARWGIAALVAVAPPDLPRLHDIAPDARVVWVTLAVTIAAGMFVALLPALSATRIAPQSALQENTRGAIGSAFRHRARAALVVAEVALAVMLTIGAGLLLRSFWSIVSIDPGFEPSRMLTWQMNLPVRIQSEEQRSAFYREFLDRMRALPGVVSVGGTSRLPLGSTGLTTTVAVEGRGTPVAEWPEVQFRRAVGDYFQTMGIPVIRGRLFNESDSLTSLPVCIINQTMAAQLFPGEDPVGRQIRNRPNSTPWTVIALVGDVKHGALDEAPQPEMYVSNYQGAMVSPYIVMRTSGDASEMVDLVRAEAQRIDRDLPLFAIQPMEAVKADSVAQRRFVLMLVGLFGALALVLAAIGVYGVMSLLVSERTQEVGVRLALGAPPSTVLRMLIGQATRLALIGIAVGLTLAIAVMPLIGNQLYGVAPRDPLTLIAVPFALMTVAIVAALIPARRAMRIEPVQALRCE